MSLEEDILIEKFIQEKLSKDDLVAFLNRMDIDEDFAKKVALEQQLREALDDSDWSFGSVKTAASRIYEEMYKSDDIIRLRNTIQDVNTTYQKRKKDVRIKWISFASAAVIALFVTISVLYPKPSTQDLYTSYLQDTELPSFISRQDGNENELIKAQLLFENKEFEQSLILFKKELKNAEAPEAGLYLYTGIAQTELNDYKEAEKTFNALSRSDLLDAQKAAWFKALLYLKMNELEKSKIVLQEIIDQKLYNHKKAKELLIKI